MYSVYLDDKQVFINLTKEEAEEKKKEFQQMIMAGVPSSYSHNDVKVLELK